MQKHILSWVRGSVK